MNSKERILTVLERNIPNSVPIFPVVDDYHAQKLTSYSPRECMLDDMKMSDGLLRALKQYKYDGIIALMGHGKNRHKQLDCKVDIRSGDVPLFVDNLIKEKEDIKKIDVPDPWKYNKIKPVNYILKEVGDTHFVIGSVRLPFEIAYIQRGSINIMTDLYEDPNFIFQMMNKTKKISLAIGNALIEAGVHALVVKDSVASASLISPKHYEKFAFPFEKEIIRHFKKKVPIILHICKNSTPLLSKMVETRSNVLEIDSPVDLKNAKELIGDKVVLKGNIDAVDMIERGTTRTIYDAVKKCMLSAKKNGNYILSTGDSVPKAASKENLKSFVRFGRKFGKY